MIGFIEAYGSALLRILPMLVCVSAGFYWGRRGTHYPTPFVSTLVTNIAVPALVFHTLMTTPLPASVLTEVLLTATGSLLVCAVLVAGLLRLMRLPVAAARLNGCSLNCAWSMA